MFKNRREFTKSLVGIGAMLGLASKVEALPDRTYVGTPSCAAPTPLPPDTRTPEEIIREDEDWQWRNLLAASDSTNTYRKWPIYTSQANIDRLMAMDLPLQNINGRDYVIRNGWPITTFRNYV